MRLRGIRLPLLAALFCAASDFSSGRRIAPTATRSTIQRLPTGRHTSYPRRMVADELCVPELH